MKFPKVAVSGSEATEAKVAVEKKAESQDVEVVGNPNLFRTSMGDVLHEVVQPKHLDRHIAFVNKEKARFSHLGWKYLRVINGGQDVEEVPTQEMAETTTGNVLCWRDMRIQKQFEAVEQSNLNKLNKAERDAKDPEKAAAEIQAAVGHDGISVVPDKSI